MSERDVRLDAGPAERVRDPLGARGGLPVQLAQLDDVRARAVLDDAGRLDDRRHAGETADHAVAADDASDALGAVDSVLDGEDHRFGPHGSSQPLGRALGVVGLDAEEDEVCRSRLRRVVGRPGRAP